MPEVPKLTSEEKAPAMPLKDWVDVATKCVGLFTFALLVITFAYEYAFFAVVGRSLQSFMSGTDYLVSAISWLPLMLIALFIYLLSVVIMAAPLRIIRSPITLSPFAVRRRAPTKREPTPALTWGLVYTGVVFFLTLGFCVWVFFALQKYAIYSMIVAAVGIALIAAIKARVEISGSFHAAMLICVVALTFTIEMGMFFGDLSLKTFGDVYQIRLKHGESEHNVVLIRNLSTGIIVRDPIASRITFLKSEEIMSMSKRSPSSDNRSAACIFLNLSCEEEKNGWN